MVSMQTEKPTPSGPSASMSVTAQPENPLRFFAGPEPEDMIRSAGWTVENSASMVKSLD